MGLDRKNYAPTQRKINKNRIFNPLRPNMLEKRLSERQLLVCELAVIVFFCFIPLLFNNPYRINIFLSWEGAYRMYLGQVPFRDFCLPMGNGCWSMRALFFKFFAPNFFTL